MSRTMRTCPSSKLTSITDKDQYCLRWLNNWNITCFLMKEVDPGLSPHLQGNPAQCASKPLPQKPTCGDTLTKCIVDCGGTTARPASAHGQANHYPGRWRLPRRAAVPPRNVAAARSPPLLIPSRHLWTKTKANLRVRPRLHSHRPTWPRVAVLSARETTVLRSVGGRPVVLRVS